MKFLFRLILIVSPLGLMAQNTIIASGNWDATSTWQSNSIADVVTENVAFTSGEKTATVRSGFDYTVGSVALAGDGNLTISGTLNIGNSGNTKNLTGSDSRDFSITGTLIIWGDVTLGDGATWTTSGTVEIKGNLTMGNNASIVNSGNFTVRGDWNSGTTTTVVSSGPMDVDGDVTVGNFSTLTNSNTFTAQSCSGPAAFCNNVLPIVLLRFEGEMCADENTLTWITTSEINFDSFEVQRSIDGVNFHEIASVKGKGFNFTALETRYSIADKNPYVGKNYYRLKSIDLDGKFIYSKIVMVRWEGDKNISLYPNPCNGSFISLTMNFQPDEKMAVQVFDNLGLILDEYDLPEVTMNKLYFKRHLGPGQYFLRFLSGQHVQVVKFTVEP